MRRTPLLAFLLVAVFGIGAQSAQAAPPPTLTGQSTGTMLVNLGSPAPISCQDNPDGGATVSLNSPFSGADGPYAGSASDKVTITLGPQDPTFHEREVLSLSGEFAIDSPAGQVSGTTRFDASGSHVGAADCNSSVPYIFTGLRYSATIVNADGVFVDRGRGRFELTQRSASQPVYDYVQTFTSDLSAPEQRESVLFGQRTPGGSFSSMSVNTKRASPFTLFAPATVRKIYAYVDGNGATSGSQTIRAVLYRNASGTPAAYVTRSFDFTVPAGMSGRWLPLYLAPAPRLNPGVYWIGIQSGATHGVARFGWNSKPNARRYNVDGFADGASDPFGSAFVDNQQLSIFAAGSY